VRRKMQTASKLSQAPLSLRGDTIAKRREIAAVSQKLGDHEAHCA
jgi:hypothetical protein